MKKFLALMCSIAFAIPVANSAVACGWSSTEKNDTRIEQAVERYARSNIAKQFRDKNNIAWMNSHFSQESKSNKMVINLNNTNDFSKQQIDQFTIILNVMLNDVAHNEKQKIGVLNGIGQTIDEKFLNNVSDEFVGRNTYLASKINPSTVKQYNFFAEIVATTGTYDATSKEVSFTYGVLIHNSLKDFGKSSFGYVEKNVIVFKLT